MNVLLRASYSLTVMIVCGTGKVRTMETKTQTGTPVIRIQRHLGLSLIGAAWEMYEATFQEINALAVQRHMMTYEEFVAVMADGRVIKYLVLGENHAVLGMSLLTNDLEAWPLISPAYFEKHWPEHYREQTVWYVGFVAVAPGQSAALFPALIAKMYEPVRDTHGVAVMDFCTYNVGVRRLPAATQAILRRLHSTARGSEIDAQSFWLWEFPEV
jgi:hypothetical protein